MTAASCGFQSSVSTLPEPISRPVRTSVALDVGEVAEPPECRSGEVLQDRLKPPECEAFGTTCTPEHPLGATMVSSEGACAAYYRYRREAV